MSFMVWNDDLATGIDIVDRQHRGLVDMLNQAAPVLALSSEASAQAIGPLLDELLAYAASHFRTEEELMARLGMASRARDHHHASHARFAEQVSRMIQAFREGTGVTGDRLLSFLASWLVLHILGEDQAMARQVRALEAGLPAEKAYETGRGDELNPAPEALSHSLVGIYSVLTRQNRELLIANRQLDSSRTEIQQHNENLEALVGQRTAELERLAEDLRSARDAAEAGSQAKSRFLGTMSHELRTPMNAILGFSRLLHEQGLPTHQDTLARKIVGAADRLLNLLNGIIDYSRLEGGGSQEVLQQAFELADMLREASAAGFAAARAKGLTTRLNIDPTLPANLRGDARLIQRILGQFISNAEKFTRQGEISVSADTLAVETDGRVRVCFSVADTGVGIPGEIQARLFQPFMQADDSLGRKFEGIGLGLALARELARLMDGQLDVASEPGKGSRFRLELVLGVSEVSRIDPAAPPATGHGALLHVGVASRPAPSSPPPKELLVSLRQLRQLLEAYDTRAGSLLAKLRPQLQPYLGERFETLSSMTEAFNYEDALAHLDAVLSQAKQGK